MIGPHVVAVADVHVGNPKWRGGSLNQGVNVRGARVLAALHAALSYAVECEASAFVVLGDLMDSSRSSPQLIAQTMKMFQSFAPLPIHLLLGNHEMETGAVGDHSLAPFALLPHVRVHDRPAVVHFGSDELWLMPFRNGPARQWLPGALEELAVTAEELRGGKPHAGSPVHVALGLHLGIADDTTPPWLRDAHDAIDVNDLVAHCSMRGVDTVLAGNWHSAQDWYRDSVRVAQCGALCPTGFNNPGFDGYGFAVAWDGSAVVERKLVSLEPRFLTVRSRAEWDRAIARVKGEPMPADPADLWADMGQPVPPPADKELPPPCPGAYVRWVADAGDAGAFAEAQGLAREESELGVLAGAEVVPDAKAAEQRAHVAASEARAVPRLAAALGAYVTAMPFTLEEPMREEVRSVAAGYLGMGAQDA